MTIVGISRGTEYSPNHIDNDAAIFGRVVSIIRDNGYVVEVCTEQEFMAEETNPDVVFGMARNPQVVARLRRLEEAGCLVINPARGIENCNRRAMTELLIAHQVAHPHSVIISLDEEWNAPFYPCWIKRGDSHAMERGDVAYAPTPVEARAILADFRSRGIASAVINEHLQGDVVKFYGVYDTDFFYWFYPDPRTHSKFGLEIINGEAREYPFDTTELRELCNRAAAVLNVPIYGGDCIVSPDGTLHIIDFNDWPSFARCRDAAATTIATYICKRIKCRFE